MNIPLIIGIIVLLSGFGIIAYDNYLENNFVSKEVPCYDSHGSVIEELNCHTNYYSMGGFGYFFIVISIILIFLSVFFDLEEEDD